ncbi:MAG: cupin domain-containing protein [Sphingobacteriales bacterium]|nr:cupin domain-containing protein [Sphingobacteriales bacterium]
MFNIFKNLPHSAAAEEDFYTLFQNEQVHIERIVSQGQSSPEGFWYRQERGEWVVLLQGSATLEYEDGTIQQLYSGDSTYIAPLQAHRVAATSAEPPCIWLAVHC